MSDPTLSNERRASLIQDIFIAEHDVVALAREHNLTPDELAAWANQPQNHRTLLGLCTLADVQTQLLLSRYRLLAATRLIHLATQQDESATPDVSRRACVDLLKVDLKRVDDAAATPDDHAPNPDALRRLLYTRTRDCENNP